MAKMKWTLLLASASVWAGRADIARKTAIDLPDAGVAASFKTADQVLQALDSEASGTSPIDFARVMEILRRANATLPNLPSKAVDWKYPGKSNPALVGERNKLLLALYNRKEEAAKTPTDIQQNIRRGFAFGYARYVFDDAWSSGPYLNPGRKDGPDYKFFKTPYTYAAWAQFLADRAFSEEKNSSRTSPDEKRRDITEKVCDDLSGLYGAKAMLKTAIRLDSEQHVPGFEHFANETSAAIDRAVQSLPLKDNVQTITGVKTYAELCNLPVPDAATSDSAPIH